MKCKEISKDDYPLAYKCPNCSKDAFFLPYGPVEGLIGSSLCAIYCDGTKPPYCSAVMCFHCGEILDLITERVYKR